MRNNDIIKAIIDATAYKQEVHFRIYDDGCWWIDMERHPYGQIRFWVGYENKASYTTNQSLYTIYRYEGALRHSCEFKVKDVIARRIENVYKALEKYNLV